MMMMMMTCQSTGNITSADLCSARWKIVWASLRKIGLFGKKNKTLGQKKIKIHNYLGSQFGATIRFRRSRVTAKIDFKSS
jgi:hypothetical protein